MGIIANASNQRNEYWGHHLWAKALLLFTGYKVLNEVF